MIDAVEKNLGRKPEQASVDSDYCSESNLEALESRRIDGYVATGRAKDATKDEVAVELEASIHCARHYLALVALPMCEQ